MSFGFVLRRLLQVVPVLIVIVLIDFLLIHLAPGDPVVALAGEHGDAEYYAFMRDRFGLDEPLPRQLATYFMRVATGDFGHSYVYGRGTFEVIMERVPATLLLTGAALLLAVVVAIPLAALAARRPHGARDVGISAVALGLYSAPAFWLAQLMILVVALQLGLAPVQGMSTAGSDAGGAAHVLDVMRHLALPAIVLASQELAVLVRLSRSSLIDEIARDHVRTARAKGVSERAVLLRHALPSAMLPAITVIGARAGHLLAGAVVVEVVFGWPGTGRLLLAALQTRDTPVLLGLFIVISCTVVVVNLLTDLAYAAIDPRIRLR
ncbi:MAG: ABC transporter permease [Gemmatimonadota bacterium]|nr:ABC transporter permease [Gemmatimonadota bacterium]